MFIAITAISILAITGLVWLFNRALPLRLRSGQAFKICPICAGVSGTWLWILAGIYSGWLEADSWKLVAAIAMGGSVVGIAYQIEKYIPSSRSPLLWKTLFIPAGFVAVYSVISLAVSPSNPSWWTAFIVTTTILVIWALRFTPLEARRLWRLPMRKRIGLLTGFTEKPHSRAIKESKGVAAPLGRASPHKMRREELEKKMKNCC